MRRRVIGLVAFLLGLSACFARPLWLFWQFSWNSEFFSYLPLIPVISGYLIWLKKPELRLSPSWSWKWGAALVVAGAAPIIGLLCAMYSGWIPATEDYLTLTITSYLLFLAAGCLTIFGTAICQVVAFPLAFLVFMIPMPTAMLDAVTAFFQQTSAVTADFMLTLSGMSVFRDGLVLNLPGDFSIMVAPECSGIHSTMVLLITAALAGHLFLKSKWKRVFLVLFVIPLAILRNGFRIYVISELCVHVGHYMINSPIHHKGGPIFFALSLIPFFALLFWLRKSELRRQHTVDSAAKAPVSTL